MAQRDKTWESAWKSAFDNKSVTPPKEVWDNIATELDKPRRRYMQPVIWWAAAAISIIAVAGILLKERIPAGQQGMEPFKVEIGQVGENRSLANAMVPEHPAAKDSKTGADKPLKNDNKVAPALWGEKKENIRNAENKKPNGNPADKNVVYDFIPGLIEGMKGVVSDLKLPEIREIWGVPMAYNTNKKTAKSGWYAGLDLSTGSSSGASDGSVSADRLAPLQSTFSQADNSSSSVTSSTSYGITVGKKVTKKIILESGISYSRLSSTGTTNIAMASVSGREAFNYNASTKDASLTTTSPYNVEHVHQFISIPVKAGYLILDRQWKISVNAGVAGDYFIKTHTADLSGNLQMYKANPATDPQWNSMSMSVLGEINVSRQLGRHYLIAVTPQMRHSVNDFSNTSTELRPSIFQVGIQLKYQF
jgi:hypothetical protein